MGNRKTLIAFGAVTLVAIVIGWFLLREEESLPIYQPSDINPALVDPEVALRTNHHVAPFSLINQYGDTVTEDWVKGKIYVADFFFTRCPSICPVMSKHISELQKEFDGEWDPLFLSHSVTPVADSVPILYRYSEKYAADPERWNILTGEKSHIYDLARKSYFATLDEGDGGFQDFIHTENFVLVDREGRLRGFYDGTSGEEVKRMVHDIRVLQRSYSGKAGALEK